RASSEKVVSPGRSISRASVSKASPTWCMASLHGMISRWLTGSSAPVRSTGSGPSGGSVYAASGDADAEAAAVGTSAAGGTGGGGPAPPAKEDEGRRRGARGRAWWGGIVDRAGSPGAAPRAHERGRRGGGRWGRRGITPRGESPPPAMLAPTPVRHEQPPLSPGPPEPPPAPP